MKTYTDYISERYGSKENLDEGSIPSDIKKILDDVRKITDDLDIAVEKNPKLNDKDKRYFEAANSLFSAVTKIKKVIGEIVT